MRLSDFDYHLPEEFIAQEPLRVRDSSKLMVINRQSGSIEHFIFRGVQNILQKGDLLVVNDTKVFPARLLGQKMTGGKIEILLLNKLSPDTWETLIRCSGSARKGLRVTFPGTDLHAEIIGVQNGKFQVLFQSREPSESVIERIGHMPLPPYIKKPTAFSQERYQTVYARKKGAVAAPTAGFHFTDELLGNLTHKGIKIAKITLRVGWGTFAPLKVEKVEDHPMEQEYFEIEEEEIQKINEQRRKRERIIAVGTTTVRALESAFKEDPYRTSGWTDLFIYPGYEFKVVNVLLTNFHLPKSTPLLLTCAFARQAGGRNSPNKLLGRDMIIAAYQEAIQRGYRFYSFGDAMLII